MRSDTFRQIPERGILIERITSSQIHKNNLQCASENESQNIQQLNRHLAEQIQLGYHATI